MCVHFKQDKFAAPLEKCLQKLGTDVYYSLVDSISRDSWSICRKKRCIISSRCRYENTIYTSKYTGFLLKLEHRNMLNSFTVRLDANAE